MHAIAVPPSRRFSGVFWWVLFALCAAPLTAGVLVSPSSITNRYTGAVDLTITGLDAPGQSVNVEEYFDADGSGTVSAPDVLIRKFQVTDGQVTSIGGQRNRNVPGDEDGAVDGAILTRLLVSDGDVTAQLNGPHLFRVSPVGSGFVPFTATLTVTQQTFGGAGISGTITESAGGTPQVGAVVLFFTGADGDIAGVTLSGPGGAYALNLPAGKYVVAAAKNGYVFNVGTAAPVTVTAGAFSFGHAVVLNPAARSISGLMRNATTLAPLGGLGVIGQSQTGFLALTFTDGNGAYVIGATADPWEIAPDEQAIARFGCLPQSYVESSGTSVTGFQLDQEAATALIYGTLKTPANVPVPFVRINGETNGFPSYKSSAVTDANGRYTLGTVPAAWRVNLETTTVGYLVQEVTVVVNSTGTATQQNLVANPVTAHLRGQVRDDSNNPVGNVIVLALEVLPGGGLGISARAQADANGNFDLGVFGGGGSSTRTWQLQLNQSDGPGTYVSTRPTFHVQDGVDINGITYLVYLVTAHLRGQVLDEMNSPVANVNVYASGVSGSLLTGSSTDGSGNFDLGLFAGTWQLGLSNITGLGIVPQTNPNVVMQTGVDQNGYVFRVRHTSGTISGTLRNAQSMPIAGVAVTGTATISGTTYTSMIVTAGDGTYALPVFSSTWDVSLNAQTLATLGYLTPAPQNVFVTTSVAGVDFAALPRPTFANYQSTYFTPTELMNPAISGLTATPASDGVTNLLKYAFNLNPKLPIGTPPALAAPLPTGLPVTSILAGAGGPFAIITYRRLISPVDLQYAVESSSALGTSGFSPAVATEDILSNDGTVEFVRAKVAIGANPRLFLRVRVTKVP